MDDTISRQQAIDTLMELIEARRQWISNSSEEIRGIDAAICALEDLPAVPTKIGKWEERTVGEVGKAVEQIQSARCSACGLYHTTPYLYYFKNYPYCPNCGEKMEGGK